MERLTKPTVGCFRYDLKNHEHEVGEFATYDAFFNYSMAVKRLGEYEETGLTPDEVRALMGANPVHTAGGCYCRECRYGLDYNGKITCTEWRGMLHSLDDFCSIGRRREET